jgi:hypothetical protein
VRSLPARRSTTSSTASLGAYGSSGRTQVSSPTSGATLAISATAAAGSGKWLMPKAQPTPANAPSRNGRRSASASTRRPSGLWRNWAADRSSATAAGSSRPSAPDPEATSSTGPPAPASALASGLAR